MELHTPREEPRLVRSLPFIAAAGSILMPVVATARWQSLDVLDRLAFSLDAAGYAAAVAPLARRHRAGWSLLWAVTVIQPLFAAAQIRKEPGAWPAATGRVAATVVLLGVLGRLRGSYA